MGNLIDGKRLSEKIHSKTARRVELMKNNGITPKLGVILVGDDKPSQTYVEKKGKAAERVGIEFELHSLPGDITDKDLRKKINIIQADQDLSGLIIQLPLPKHLDRNAIVNMIRPEIDVDCLTEVNLGKLVMNTSHIVPPTPGAVMSILKELGAWLAGANVTIIGTGSLVGKPLAMMMLNAEASVTTCNSKTRDINKKCLAADIIVTGVGKKDILRGDMVSDGAIVVDTGVSFVGEKMFGDVNIDEVMKKAAHVTPTPGGVGPLTVARLLWNTAECAAIASSLRSSQ